MLVAGKNYLDEAQKWAALYLAQFKQTQPLNLYDVGALAHLEVARVLSSSVALRGQLVENLRAALAAAVKVAGTDPFGCAFDYSDGMDATPMIMVRPFEFGFEFCASVCVLRGVHHLIVRVRVCRASL